MEIGWLYKTETANQSSMKNPLLIFCLIFIGCVSVKAQQPKPTPRSTPNPREEILRQMREREIANQAFERLRAINSRVDGRRNLPPARLHNIRELYRKPTKKELEILAPLEEDARKYAGFLQSPNTGLTKLAADKGCADSTTVIVATAVCLAYTMPGAGSSYSFRTRNYRIARLADVTFTENSFQATGIRLHGIFVNIGDVPLEQVNLQTKGMDFLTGFKPEADFQKAKDVDEQFSEGIEKNGFIYRRALRALDETTYVLRSVAYRGKYFRAISGLTYNELDFDKRFDVIVAFRIVRRHEDGSITILWKQLAKQVSPKTKWDEKQQKL